MRNSTRRSTPKTNGVQDESASNAEKTNAKKLRQARLPFKVIAPASSPIDSKGTTTSATLGTEKNSLKDRKRKLSYETDDETNINTKEDDNVSKENVLAAAAKKKKSDISNNDTITEVILLVGDDAEDDVESREDDIANLSATKVSGKKDLDARTPKSSTKDKNNGAGTPQTSSGQKDKDSTATKLQIKLPLSGGKKKRRKSNLNQTPFRRSAAENSLNHTQELSSDDIEEIAIELNPQKRKKMSTKGAEAKTAETKSTYGLNQQIQSKTNEDNADPSATRQTSEDKLKNNKSIKRSLEQCKNIKNDVQTTDKVDLIREVPTRSLSNSNINTVLNKTSDNIEKIIISDSSDENENPKDDKEDPEESVLSDNDNEADDETDNLAASSIKVLSDIPDITNSKNKNATDSLNRGDSPASSSKTLTPKQVKLMEQRRKAREEKERKLQEEKMKKQAEKEEKEMAKKREREEKEELKRKEREEKEDQKRKEREEKERKRLAEVEAKNEEKRKKNEAKEEELRKKEEERKRKEHEKEEAELKKKKAAQAFTKFFVTKTPNNTQLKNEEDSNTGDGAKLLAFRPFQIKGDMKLAPILRKDFTAEEKDRLDYILGCKNEADEDVVPCKPLPKSQLYLSELRSGIRLPGKWRRASTEFKDDVILIEDELERVGQAIVEDTPAYIREEMRVKFYKFHDNRRPPYYGTWRKKSAVVNPRKPFAQDKKFFDYEVDSDDEWEEEEPGESLEDGSDEDKEKESEDDDYEVDNEWFVPHGHLSDEELQNEDEYGMGDDNTREAQIAKLQLLQQEFAQEMKKKTEKIKPRLIGCIWADINGNHPPECAKILWETLEKKAMIFNEPPLIEEPEVDRTSEANSPSAASNSNAEKTTDKLKPISLSDDMVKDLTRLVHGNNHAKNFLINEYIAYVEKTEDSVKNGSLRKPLKSVVRDKIDEIAEWQSVDAQASSLQEIKKASDETNDKKKKKVKRRLCWVVKEDMLNKMDLSSLELKNSWKYTLPPKFMAVEKEIKKDERTTKLAGEEGVSTSADEGANTSSRHKSGTGTKSNDNVTLKERKRVPLLMSVERGQQISTPAKNKLISKFLQQKDKDTAKPKALITRSNAVTSPNIEDDDVVILD